MNYEVSEKKGETKTVGLVEKSDHHYEVTIDGRTVQVDAAKSGKTIYSIIEDGKQNNLDPAVVRTKERFDPQGLLNPGKLRSWAAREAFAATGELANAA